MQKIVFDTNVIISALLQTGYPNKIISELFIEQKFQLCVLAELIAEYLEVLARPKFTKFQDFFISAEALLAKIETKAIKYILYLSYHFISAFIEQRGSAATFTNATTGQITLRHYKTNKQHYNKPPNTFFNIWVVLATGFSRIFFSSLATRSNKALVARSVTKAGKSGLILVKVVGKLL